MKPSSPRRDGKRSLPCWHHVAACMMLLEIHVILLCYFMLPYDGQVLSCYNYQSQMSSPSQVHRTLDVGYKSEMG